MNYKNLNDYRQEITDTILLLTYLFQVADEYSKLNYSFNRFRNKKKKNRLLQLQLTTNRILQRLRARQPEIDLILHKLDKSIFAETALILDGKGSRIATELLLLSCLDKLYDVNSYFEKTMPETN